MTKSPSFIDEDLLTQVNGKQKLATRFWQPTQAMIVMGRSSSLEREINLDNCQRDNIPVTRRLGGGCSVVLAPGMIVISVAYQNPLETTAGLLQNYTERIAESLKKHSIRELSIQGTSDLCIGDQKIMGSCLYKSKDAYLFQASLLINCNLALIERYLNKPIRQPSYRRDRSHLDFVTSLEQQGYRCSCADVQNWLQLELNTHDH